MDKKNITEDIYYIDNFLDNDFIDHLHDKVYHTSLWTKHRCKREDPNFYWGTYINEEYFKDEMEYFQKIFKNFEIKRIYVNGQSGIQHGNIHDDDGDITFLLGFTKNWSVESGGATEFFIKKDDITTSFSIYPVYNRLMRFPAKVKHRALPSIDIENLRMTLAIKTLTKKQDQLNPNFVY